ncbi:hypothetical protein [Luteolibacter sp. LG18]|uniref:hypothetical protein n=1 Tax=Luteolibacter sp. LG18 TaxID=2819286 RepID=UPI002B2E280E|nr:hypothetical protein llg_19150 [Luteolibacter sp. LG18]
MGLFDDMMSSGRGPGLIGTLLALLVVVGFGGLFFMVTDEGMLGGAKSIESVIRDQGKRVEELKSKIRMKEESLQVLPERQRIAKEEEVISRQTRLNEGEVTGRRDLLPRIGGEIAAMNKDFEAYKQAYRNQVRAQAKGATFAEIKTLKGRVFRNVTVSSVDAVGMSFKYEDGSSRADFVDLPAEIQERFQYDPDEQQLAKKAESSTVMAHNDEVNRALADQAQKNRDTADRKKADQLVKDTAELAALEASIQPIDQKILETQTAWDKDRAQARTSGGLVDSARYSEALNTLKSKRAANVRRIAELRASTRN